jgi:hypothetical protein
VVPDLLQVIPVFCGSSSSMTFRRAIE